MCKMLNFFFMVGFVIFAKANLSAALVNKEESHLCRCSVKKCSFIRKLLSFIDVSHLKILVIQLSILLRRCNYVSMISAVEQRW